MEDIIYGRNPVIEALDSGHEINKMLILEGSRDKSLQKVIDKAKEKKILIQYTDRKQLDKTADGENHQGVIAYVSPYHYVTVDELLDIAKLKNEAPLLIICDEITDPHNLGSLIRTAKIGRAHV